MGQAVAAYGAPTPTVLLGHPMDFRLGSEPESVDMPFAPNHAPHPHHFGGRS